MGILPKWGQGGRNQTQNRLRDENRIVSNVLGVLRDGTEIMLRGDIDPLDDVTGFGIPQKHIGTQDGLVKDVRKREGSWEKSWRHEKEFIILYDPTKGYPTRAAGEYDD